MVAPSDFIVSKKKYENESLLIGGDNGRISGNINVFAFTDSETGQRVMYIPAFEVSGYGATNEKANEMLAFSLQEYFSHLKSLSAESIKEELSEFGWNNIVAAEEFSRECADIELHSINAVGGKVDRITLAAA